MLPLPQGDANCGAGNRLAYWRECSRISGLPARLKRDRGGDESAHPPLMVALELRHAEFTGELIQPAHQRRRDRNSVARPRHPRGVAALAGNENPVDAGHPAGVSDIADQGIDTRLEVRDIAEG